MWTTQCTVATAVLDAGAPQTSIQVSLLGAPAHHTQELARSLLLPQHLLRSGAEEVLLQVEVLQVE
jgi:hypothetical protein